jgi:hypothetical protein
VAFGVFTGFVGTGVFVISGVLVGSGAEVAGGVMVAVGINCAVCVCSAKAVAAICVKIGAVSTVGEATAPPPAHAGRLSSVMAIKSQDIFLSCFMLDLQYQ